VKNLFANSISTRKSSRPPRHHRSQSHLETSSASRSNSSSKSRSRSHTRHDETSTSNGASAESSSTTTYDDTNDITPVTGSSPLHAAEGDQLLLHIGGQFQGVSRAKASTVVSSDFGDWSYSKTTEDTPMERYGLQEVEEEPWNVVGIDGELSYTQELQIEDFETDLEI